MIKHYDMTTGEAITDKASLESAARKVQAETRPELRLLTVEEASAARMNEHKLPVDIATLPADLLISRHS